jgi:hypothetical protein
MPDAVSGSQVVPSYDTSAAETTTDNVTHLVWQRDVPALYSPICSGQYTVTAPTGDACFWAEASMYCATLKVAGSRWRLPTKIELESLQDDTRPGGMQKIDPAFPPTHSGYYWTSAPSVGESGKHWVVDFDRGWSTAADDQFRLFVTIGGAEFARVELLEEGCEPPSRRRTPNYEKQKDAPRVCTIP